MANPANYNSAQVRSPGNHLGQELMHSCLRTCHEIEDNHGYIKWAVPSRVKVLADLVEGFLHFLHLLQLPATDNFIF